MSIILNCCYPCLFKREEKCLSLDCLVEGEDELCFATCVVSYEGLNWTSSFYGKKCGVTDCYMLLLLLMELGSEAFCISQADSL